MNSVPARASRTQEYPDIEEDDSYYPQRLPTSARRYTTTYGQRVIQQGNRRIIIHDEPPPKKQRSHWLFFVGIGMMLMFIIWFALQMLSNWWILHQEDSMYGFPRTYQTDQVVGHGDSTNYPSHFIFENLAGHVVIIEIPGGNIAHARIYSGPTLFSDNAGLIPVTADFKDVNNDGKVDMIIVVQNQQIVFLNDGAQFKPQQ